MLFSSRTTFTNDYELKTVNSDLLQVHKCIVFHFFLAPPGYNRMGDTYSDSGHSEISSRSSLVSNSSFDMAQEERRLRHSGVVGDSHIGGSRLERRATTDPDQYSLG